MTERPYAKAGIPDGRKNGGMIILSKEGCNPNGIIAAHFITIHLK